MIDFAAFIAVHFATKFLEKSPLSNCPSQILFLTPSKRVWIDFKNVQFLLKNVQLELKLVSSSQAQAVPNMFTMSAPTFIHYAAVELCRLLERGGKRKHFGVLSTEMALYLIRGAFLIDGVIVVNTKFCS